MNRKNITFTPKPETNCVEMCGILRDGRVITYMHVGQALIFTVNEENVKGFLLKLEQHGTAVIED